MIVGLADEVGTFSSRADDLNIRGILPVVYPIDCLTTWSASVYNVGQRSQIYDSFLE